MCAGVHLPNLIPGLSSRTLSRLSLAKNMYADRPRLGALGSGSDHLALHSAGRVRRRVLPFLRLPPSVFLDLRVLVVSLGILVVLVTGDRGFAVRQ